MVTHHLISQCGFLGWLQSEFSSDSENLSWIRSWTINNTLKQKAVPKHRFKNSRIKTILPGALYPYTGNCTEFLCSISLLIQRKCDACGPAEVPSSVSICHPDLEKYHSFLSNRHMAFNHIQVKHNLLEHALWTILCTAYSFNLAFFPSNLNMKHVLI